MDGSIKTAAIIDKKQVNLSGNFSDVKVKII
jgi:hypothetical protein